MTIADEFNLYVQFDKATQELKDIAKKNNKDLSKIIITNAEVARKFRAKRNTTYNYN